MIYNEFVSDKKDPEIYPFITYLRQLFSNLWSSAGHGYDGILPVPTVAKKHDWFYYGTQHQALLFIHVSMIIATKWKSCNAGLLVLPLGTQGTTPWLPQDLLKRLVSQAGGQTGQAFNSA